MKGLTACLRRDVAKYAYQVNVLKIYIGGVAKLVEICELRNLRVTKTTQPAAAVIGETVMPGQVTAMGTVSAT